MYFLSSGGQKPKFQVTGESRSLRRLWVRVFPASSSFRQPSAVLSSRPHRSKLCLCGRMASPVCAISSASLRTRVVRFGARLHHPGTSLPLGFCGLIPAAEAFSTNQVMLAACRGRDAHVSPGPAFSARHVLGVSSQRVAHGTSGARRVCVSTVRLPPPGGPGAKAEIRPQTQAVPGGLAPLAVSGEGLSLGRAARPQGLAVKGALFSVLCPGVLGFSLGSKSWLPTPQHLTAVAPLLCGGVVYKLPPPPRPSPSPIQRW